MKNIITILMVAVISLWGGDQFRTEFVHLKSACSP